MYAYPTYFNTHTHIYIYRYQHAICNNHGFSNYVHIPWLGSNGETARHLGQLGVEVTPELQRLWPFDGKEHRHPMKQLKPPDFFWINKNSHEVTYGWPSLNQVEHGTQKWCCWKWVFCPKGWFSDSMLNVGRVSSRRCWKSRGWHFHPNWTHVLVDHMFFLSLSSCSIWPLLNYIAKLLAEFSRFATISWNNFQVTAVLVKSMTTIMSTSKCSRGLLRMMTSALTYPNTGRPWITDNWMRASMNKLQGHIPI